MTAPAVIDVPPRTVLDYLNLLLETYAIAAEEYALDDKDVIEVCKNVKVPGDAWRGYVFMARVFYPQTDGEDCDNFKMSMATRIRRALSFTLKSTSDNDRALSDTQADALQEKIYATLHPGGMDASTASEEDERTGEDGAHIVDVSSRWNGKKMETAYTVDFGRGDVREFTKYGLKQSFADEWKNMLHRYKLASEKAMPTRMELKGAARGRRVDSRGAAINGRGNLLSEGTDLADLEQVDDVFERAGAADMEGLNEIDGLDGLEALAEGPGSDGTSGQALYRKGLKPQQGSTMVDSTDGRKNFSGGRPVVTNRREGHGEGGMVQDAKHRNVNVKHRMSEPIPLSHGLVARRDLQLERLPNSGPIRKRQRMSLNTPRTGLTSHLDRTPLTGDGERGFLGTRTDTASLAMEFMSRVLHNEDALKAEVEDLVAQNKYLQGLLEDEELALNIADDELTDIKRERQERLQLEELLRSREQELRSVKLSLRKIHSKNENALKDLTIEKEEWKAIATQAQDQLDRQLEEHATNVQKLEEAALQKASLVYSRQIEQIKQDFSLQRDKWGKDAALKLNEIEVLRTAKTNLTEQLKTSQAKIKTLEADLGVVRSEAEARRKEHTMLSRRMQEDVTKMRAEAKEQSERAAKVLLNADQQLSQAMAMHDAWSKVPDGIQNVQHFLEFEDISGERVKSMEDDSKRLFMRLRPSQWKRCRIKSCRHDKSNSFVFTVEESKPGTAPGAPGSSSLFDVDLDELKKREYCQRAMSEFLLQKVKPKSRPGSSKAETKSAEKSVDKSQEARAMHGSGISGASYRTMSREVVSDVIRASCGTVPANEPRPQSR